MSRKKLWQQLDEDHPALKYHSADAGYIRVCLPENDTWFLLSYADLVRYPAGGEWQLIKDKEIIDRYEWYGRAKVNPPTTWANKAIASYYHDRV